MASVTGLTKERMEAIEAASVVMGAINLAGHLILTTYGGTEIDAGEVIGSVPDASDTVKGLVELATNTEATTGTDTTRAVTPAGVKAVADALTSTLMAYIDELDGRVDILEVATLALDNLTDVVITTPSAGHILRYSGSAWVNVLGNLDALSDVTITSPSANHVLQHDGSGWVNGAFVPTAGYYFGGSVVFSSGGTFSKGSYPGLRAVGVHVYGPGGAGGGSQASGATGSHSKGGGGGSGAYGYKFILVGSLGTNETVTVGTGGTGVSAAAGNNGSGSSAFGTHCTAGAGSGGTHAASSNAVGYGTQGGAGGAAGTGDVTLTGGPGGYGMGSAGLCAGGNGGDTPGPHGGRGGVGRASASSTGNLAGNVGRPPGGGGSGAISNGTGNSQPGGDGADGRVTVDLYY